MCDNATSALVTHSGRWSSLIYMFVVLVPYCCVIFCSPLVWYQYAYLGALAASLLCQ